MLYRIIYGAAHRLERYDMAPGRHDPDRELGRLWAEVVRELGEHASRVLKMICPAVQDAAEARDTRW